MSDIKQFRLPDVGEGLTEGEILRWYVAPGDAVTVNQPLVEVETAKAAVELPSPYAGVVAEILVPAGATVDVGTPIIALETDPAGAERPVPAAVPHADLPGQGSAERPARGDVVAEIATGAAEVAASADPEPAAGLVGGLAPGGRTSVLVGYGPRAASVTRRPRLAGTRQAPGPIAERAAPASGGALGRVLAKPPVRRLARDLGVDLAGVTPTGPQGRVTRGDVEAAARGTAPAAPPARSAAPSGSVGPAAAQGVGGAAPAVPADERVPVRGVQRHMADAMVRSAFTAPHVTEFVTVDVTRTVDLLARLRALPEFAGATTSPLLAVARACCLALRRHRVLNATWDADAGEVVLRGRVGLGIAAATPRGLVVPVIRDADRLSLADLGRALAGLAATAREGRTAPADLSGGSFTITNIGVFGIDSGTPIINPGEAGILALGAFRRAPWVVGDTIEVRTITTLGLSFDHRVVDGEHGSRFLADVAGMLADPDLILARS